MFMRVNRASKMLAFLHTKSAISFNILSVQRYFVGTNKICLSANMYRQISRVPTKLRHYWGAVAPPPPPPPAPPLATLVVITSGTKLHGRYSTCDYLDKKIRAGKLF